MDAVAQAKWDEYSSARNEMLLRTDTPLAPWHVVRADEKKQARLASMQHVLERIAPPELLQAVGRPDPDVLFPFTADAIQDGRLAL
jgi:hypothetical protein